MWQIQTLETETQAATSPNSPTEMTDTLRMAAIVKKDQGYHETEVSFGGETDLHKAVIMCEKNENHKMFIPVKKFNIEHLPPAYRDCDTVDLVRAWAHQTCRVSVTRISENRPEFFTGTDKPFPYHQHGGRSDMLMTGTGWVYFVKRYTEKDNRTCGCEECVELDLAMRKKVRGEVWVHTAAHVVYDNTEAAHTSCGFFYDDVNTDVSKVPKLYGGEVRNCDIKGDYCEITFTTHDVELVEKLHKMYCRCLDLEKRLHDKYHQNNVQRITSRDLYFLHKLAVCISHPHGCCKQISLGEVTHRQILHSEKLGDGSVVESSQYTYNTPTCPGSSGARVFTPGCSEKWSLMYLSPGLSHVHSEGHPGNVNRSAVMKEEFASPD